MQYAAECAICTALVIGRAEDLKQQKFNGHLALVRTRGARTMNQKSFHTVSPRDEPV